jgi:hypothetical protein
VIREQPYRLVADSDAVADVYRATPLQQGMLFHSQLTPGSGTYLNQQSYALRGDLDVRAFRAAFTYIIARHPALRTAFVHDQLGAPLQIVQHDAPLPWSELDWRDVPGDEHEPRIAALLRELRAHDFDLARPPLMSLLLVRRGDQLYQFIWRYHLMLLDGWSVAVIFSEVLAAYDAIVRGAEPALPSPRPYRDYMDWLERQDRARGEAYWRRTLQGVTGPTPLGEDRAPNHELAPDPDTFRAVEAQLSESDSRQLRAFARRHRLTLNTVVSGAWALTLARGAGTSDVVFGSVFAGRPTELAGMETMVGLFINNLPVRARVIPDVGVVPWLQALQAQQAEAREFEYMSLLDILPLTDVARGTPLFESILIFQNYPFKASLATVSGNLELVAASSVEVNSFPITMVIEPGARFSVRCTYDSRRFDESTVMHLVERFTLLVAASSAVDDQTLGSVGLARPARRQLIDGFNRPLGTRG